MSRPRKDTEAGGIASRKWKATMLKKYGNEEGIRAYFQEIGKKGGSAPTKRPKGFAANPSLARLSGHKGGRISRRTGVKNGFGKNHIKDINNIERTLENLVD